MITALIITLVFIALYLYGTRTFTYWEKRGVKHDKPIVFLGNNAKGYLMQKSVTQISIEVYWKYAAEKVVGFYRSVKPELLIRDPEIIKRILVTDFSSFHPRAILPQKQNIEPLFRNLFFADGDLWKLLRQRTTVAFTSSKLKAMFPLIVERAQRLKIRALETAACGKTIDARDLIARYNTDFIGTVGFGINADSLDDEDSAFRKLGAKIFHVSLLDAVLGTLKDFFPSTLKHFHYMQRVEKDVINLVKVILKQRNYEPSGRNDFIDIMLECRKKGQIVSESIEHFKADGTPELATLEMDDEVISAQAFIFFAAGFETSSSASSYTLHLLAYHPETQQKVQHEIDCVLAKHDNKLSYESIQEMTYLEWSLKESMRIFPSVGFLMRECVRKYTFPDLHLTIGKGVSVMIPVQALHNDPEYFESPTEFRPERFHPDNFGAKQKLAYLPFGDGPRACVGSRLGLMQSLAGLAAVLSCCSVEPAPETVRHPVVDPKSDVVQIIVGGLPLLFKPRTNVLSTGN